MATVTLKGNEIHTLGNLPKVGDHFPAFNLVKNDLSAISNSNFEGKKVVFNNDDSNRILSSDPVYNIRDDKLKEAKEYFQALPSDHHSLIS